ncbi:methylated-DNA--[protein]-cysteine S-methyltransferase [Streptomyces sp. NPDC088261]|uniref:methylated-DNA--[protein]-cysteine S-methyltransferase n=1 Tax=Streptomyces sp. NPDC088261 TaxID=3365851 RepID=UPI0037F54053
MRNDQGVGWFSVETPLPTGGMRIGVTDQGVVSTVAFGARAGGDADLGAESGPYTGPDLTTEDRRAAAVTTQLAEYFAGRRREFDLPIDWRATTGAQQAVLRTLHRTVGYGTTITYGELGDRSGAFEDDSVERGLRAKTVGSIMGSAPVSVLVPCHRVVAAGGIGGYGGGETGLATKRWLLTLEGVLAPTLDWS